MYFIDQTLWNHTKLFEGANVHRLSNRDVILWVTDLRHYNAGQFITS